MQLSQERKNTESTTPVPSGLAISATTIYQPSTIITIYPPSTNITIYQPSSNIIDLPIIEVNVGTRWENSYHILFPKGRSIKHKSQLDKQSHIWMKTGLIHV